jgi:cell division protein FtsI/penicillin-binding protein 2
LQTLLIAAQAIGLLLMTAVAVGIVALVVMPVGICFVESREEHKEPRKRQRSLRDVAARKTIGERKNETIAKP